MSYIKLEELQKFPIRKDHYDKEHGSEDFIFGVESVLEYAEYLPTYTFDTPETKHGYWILWLPRSSNQNAIYRCSCCGKLRSSHYDDVGEWEYCPCGAKMDAESDKNDTKETCETCKHRGKRCYCAPGDSCREYEVDERLVNNKRNF